jgi:hypothetical protein
MWTETKEGWVAGYNAVFRQVRNNESTRPKAQYAPLRSNYDGHVTENNIYIPKNTGHQKKTHFDDQLEIREITELERTQMDAIDRLKKTSKDNMVNLGNLGRKEAHSSQPEACRNTLDPSNISPSLFSSRRRDRTLWFETGFSSAFKTWQTDYNNSARHPPPPQVGDLQVGRQVTQSVKPPQVGHPQVGRQVTQGVEPPQAGHLQVGWQAMLDIRIPKISHLQVGRMSQAEQEASLKHVIKT